ncbi:MAG: DUF4112 domain-containing protein [Saprospiraceae bacterium]|nr:DUF4112 domain-containing protein [Saprospiraceae bacterium]
MPQEQQQFSDKDLARLEAMSKLMDNQFVIPGTNYRFGLDGIIGLIPYVGDIAGLMISTVLLRIMMNKGAGPLIMLRMMGNYALDTLIGIVPVVGDLFDFGFKANRRNVEMLKRYYASGAKRPNAKYSVAFLGILMLLFLGGMIWLAWKAAAFVVAWIWAAFQQG